MVLNQKIIGGIGGAVKSLLDFFVFGIAEMIQDAIVWLLELFGFDDAAVAVGDFNLVGKIKESVFAVIDFVVELFQFKDTSLSGIFKSLIDIINEIKDNVLILDHFLDKKSTLINLLNPNLTG